MIEYEREDLKNRLQSAVREMQHILNPNKSPFVCDWHHVYKLWKKVKPVKMPSETIGG